MKASLHNLAEMVRTSRHKHQEYILKPMSTMKASLHNLAEMVRTSRHKHQEYRSEERRVGKECQ
jgi:predicted transcriptional regulator